MSGSSDSSASLPESLPCEGALLGVDYGTKRVGLAISTREQTIASPLEIYKRRNTRLDEKYFREIAADYRIVGCVVGLPIHLSGEEGQKAREAREYGGVGRARDRAADHVLGRALHKAPSPRNTCWPPT